MAARLIQFTDPHLYGDAAATVRGIATLPALERALAHAQAPLREASAVLVTGDIVQWTPNDSAHEVTDPSCGVDAPAYERASDESYGCADDGPVGVPAVLPILDVNVAAKFNINNRFTIRLEGGVHDLIYGGATLGIRF